MCTAELLLLKQVQRLTAERKLNDLRLIDVIRSPIGCEHFENFLSGELSVENLVRAFLLAIC